MSNDLLPNVNLIKNVFLEEKNIWCTSVFPQNIHNPFGNEKVRSHSQELKTKKNTQNIYFFGLYIENVNNGKTLTPISWQMNFKSFAGTHTTEKRNEIPTDYLHKIFGEKWRLLPFHYKDTHTDTYTSIYKGKLKWIFNLIEMSIDVCSLWWNF